MYNKCCIVGCDSRRMDCILHKFPKTETGLKKWLSLINSDELRKMSVAELSKQFICRKHFQVKFFTSDCSRPRLRVGAYPTLFTESEISSGVPLTRVPQFEDAPNKSNWINHDHTYNVKKRALQDHNYCKTEVVEKRMRLNTDGNIKNIDDGKPRVLQQNASSSEQMEIAHYADGNKVSPIMHNTAEIVSFFDQLFDSVNGASVTSKKSRGKPLRQAVTVSSHHHVFKNCKEYISLIIRETRKVFQH